MGNTDIPNPVTHPSLNERDFTDSERHIKLRGQGDCTCNIIAPNPARRRTNSIGLYPNWDPAWRSTLQFPLHSKRGCEWLLVLNGRIELKIDARIEVSYRTNGTQTSMTFEMVHRDEEVLAPT